MQRSNALTLVCTACHHMYDATARYALVLSSVCPCKLCAAFCLVQCFALSLHCLASSVQCQCCWECQQDRNGLAWFITTALCEDVSFREFAPRSHIMCYAGHFSIYPSVKRLTLYLTLQNHYVLRASQVLACCAVSLSRLSFLQVAAASL